MHTHSTRSFTLLSLLALLAASPGCEYFSPTTVPSVDTTRPLAWASAYTVADQHVGLDYETWAAPGSLYSSGDSWQYVIDDPDELHMALAATTDSGGAKRVTMTSVVRHKCLGSSTWYNLESVDVRHASQAGSVGSTVDNGVWTGRPFTVSDYFDDVASCSYGYISMDWLVRAEDFHGNLSHHDKNRLIYLGPLN